MKKRLLQWLLVLGTMLLTLGGYHQLAHAESVGYTVNAILPKNQDDAAATYFALRMKPNQQQKLAVVITNQTKQTQRFQVRVNQAITNENGVIDYSQSNPTLDQSLKTGIKDIFAKPSLPTVTIPGKKSKTVSLKVKMPATQLNGMILGGINVQKLNADEKKAKKGVMINNRFAYVIGVRLRESGVNVAPNLKLLAVEAGQTNSLNQVKAQLQNPEPGIMNNLKVKAQVTKQGDSQVILKNEKANMSMAPNSNFKYAIPWGNTQLKAGTYTLTLDATAKGGYKWHFVKNFTVTQKQLSKLSNKFNQPQQKSYFWWFVGGGVIIVALLAVILYLLLKNRRRQDKD
ncbi:DUF916 and DUF3324 domain-containing protein [Levilactobacillus acidifarinae]|uniref:Cell surface protein n=1 Tax=Levilactobacillus acidifarinae DSM 19394 = JCM 15949 TaxID=1423715 RepID=A0A0R1LVB5_9LACO|nr:DUF916 and DUF3324 domain-containing protein [Levilactobacillus acidifarinae]KRK95527.1 cell surface protein [Levilactobacillus acidifarinae DSM 19394]GEO70228.1 cell surface protein [Levilactobacillus acidifarinae]